MILLLTLAVPVAFGQDEEEAGPTTLDIVQRAAFLIGEWDISGQVMVADAMQDITGVSTIDWDLEQHGIRENWTATINGQVVEGISFWVYDAPNGRWQMIRTDTQVTPGIMQMFGQLNGNTEFVAYTQGGDVTTRYLITATDADTLEMSLGTSASLIDPFEPSWTMTYTRSSGAQTADDIRAAGTAVAAPPEVGQFSFLEGQWDVAAQVTNADTGEMMDVPATSTVEQTLGGTALSEVWQGTFAEGDVRTMWTLTTFNAETSQWEQASVDTTDAGFTITTGGACGETGCSLGSDTYSITDTGIHWERAGEAGPTAIMDYTRSGS
jgi:hypothetical protein